MLDNKNIIIKALVTVENELKPKKEFIASVNPLNFPNKIIAPKIPMK